MSPESKQHLISRINQYSGLIETPEFINFDDHRLFSRLSSENQAFLFPIRNKLKIYNSCLNSVHRWQGHPYSQDFNHIGDTDYEHVIGMLDILHQLQTQGINNINSNIVELMILFHDGGEIITDDISLIHSKSDDDHGREMKENEPIIFSRCVLSQIRSEKRIHQRIDFLYKRYEGRQNHPEDYESQLVKLIDILQGDEYGLTNLYNKIESVYKNKTIPIDPHRAIKDSLFREFFQLQKVLQSTISQSDANVVTNYVSGWQKKHFSDSNSIYHQEYLLYGLHNLM